MKMENLLAAELAADAAVAKLRAAQEDAIREQNGFALEVVNGLLTAQLEVARTLGRIVVGGAK
jgi:hypothetical protein